MRSSDAAARLRRLEAQLAAIVPSWSMAPVVAAYQAMRGASFLVAVTFAAEIGDAPLCQPAPADGLPRPGPRERSTGATVRRAGLTLAGNRRARCRPAGRMRPITWRSTVEALDQTLDPNPLLAFIEICRAHLASVWRSAV